MSLRNIPIFAASALVATALTGCGGAYTHAASSYADASGASTDAISTTRTTAADMCLKKARIRYLDGRLKEDAKIPPWNDFFKMKGNATDKLSWDEYCKEIDKTAELFDLGVSALSDYSAALGALAKTADYDGSHLKDMGAKAGAIAGSLGAAEAPAAAIQPVGNIVGTLGGIIFNAVTERNIKAYVIAADQKVQDLIKALENYIKALGTTLATTDDARRTVIKNAEKGMVTTPADAAKIVQFYQLASSLEDEGRHTKETLDGYLGVLKKMSEAHTQLVKASSKAGTDEDAVKVLGAVADLIEQINTLRSALAKKE